MSVAGAVYDLILSTDVFIYLGDLSEVFTACKKVLAPGGLFAFSVEAADEGESYVLRSSMRYAHPLGYLRQLAESVGLQEIRVDGVELRTEHDKPIKGHLLILQQPSE